eukprot:COSAG06_NODE_1330_length_9845_cov_6.248204_5_plen_181_part_00
MVYVASCMREQLIVVPLPRDCLYSILCNDSCHPRTRIALIRRRTTIQEGRTASLAVRWWSGRARRWKVKSLSLTLRCASLSRAVANCARLVSTVLRCARICLFSIPSRRGMSPPPPPSTPTFCCCHGADRISGACKQREQPQQPQPPPPPPQQQQCTQAKHSSIHFYAASRRSRGITTGA